MKKNVPSVGTCRGGCLVESGLISFAFGEERTTILLYCCTAVHDVLIVVHLILFLVLSLDRILVKPIRFLPLSIACLLLWVSNC